MNVLQHLAKNNLKTSPPALANPAKLPTFALPIRKKGKAASRARRQVFEQAVKLNKKEKARKEEDPTGLFALNRLGKVQKKKRK